MEQAQKPKMSPKDFFLYLAAAVTLYISAGSLIRLLFEIIDAVFPDRLDAVRSFYGAGGALRFAIASLIIIFPLYLFVVWLIRKDIIKNVAKYELSIRKWFIYFTLFLAGAVVVGDLIALVNIFLNGEITTRFIFKVLSVLIVAGAIFIYYIYDLRRAKSNDVTIHKPLIWLSGLVVLGAVVGGFFVMGSPGTQRQLRFDRERVQNLQSIQFEVTNYWQNKGALPPTLEALEDSITGFVVPLDPDTEAPYEYRATGAQTFSLCAVFSLEGDGVGVRSFPTKGNNWDHNAGRHCFERSIDEDIFPIRLREAIPR